MFAKNVTSLLASAIVLAAATAAGTGTAPAQTYPSKLIKIVIPVTPGSPVDVKARLLAPLLQANLGQTVIVENRPGAGGTIGIKAVATAEPDGHTLLLHSASFATASAAYPNLGYDPIKDFAPVSTLGTSYWYVVVPAPLPVKTLAEFVSSSKANPGTLNFGFGLASTPHVLGEAFKVISGADFASIPYRGGAPAIADMLGGRVHLNFGTPATLLPLIRDGKIRAIATTNATRSADLPDVPTMAEAGFPRLTATFWTGVMAPAGTPAAVVARLNAAIHASVKTPEMQVGMARTGFDTLLSAPQEFAATIASDIEKWSALIKLSGVKIE